jgi:hypothetical protein
MLTIATYDNYGIIWLLIFVGDNYAEKSAGKK